MPPRPRLCEWHRQRLKALYRVILFFLANGGIVRLGFVRLETDAPHRVIRAGFSQAIGASVQKVLFHGRVLCELGT